MLLGGTSPDRGWDSVAGGRSGPPVCGQPWFTEDAGAQGSRLHFAQGQAEAVDQSAFLTLEGCSSWYTRVQVRGGSGFRNKMLRGGASSLTEVRGARPPGSGTLSAPPYGFPGTLCPRPRPHSAERRQPGRDSCLSSDVSSWEHVVRAAGRGRLLCRVWGRGVRRRTRRARKQDSECGSPRGRRQGLVGEKADGRWGRGGAARLSWGA